MGRAYFCMAWVGWWLCCFCLGTMPIYAQAEESASTRLVPHQVQKTDTIRGLLLRYSCVRSMTQYSALREEFRHANPQILHSGHLASQASVLVPGTRATQGTACLRADTVQVVRVECEHFGAQDCVRIYVDGPVLPEVFLLKHEPPVRVVCDFDQAVLLSDIPKEIDCAGRLIQRVRVGHEDTPVARARIVLEINPALAGEVEQTFFEQQSLFMLTVHEAKP